MLSAQTSLGLRTGVYLSNNPGVISMIDPILPIKQFQTSGFSIGIPLEAPLNHRASLLAEMGWLSKGIHFKAEHGPNYHYYKANDTHLTLTVLNKWRLVQHNRAELGIQAGFSAEYFIRTKWETQGELYGFGWQKNGKINSRGEDNSRLSGGITFGFYAATTLRSGKVFFDFRFNPGARLPLTTDGYLLGPQNRGTHLCLGYLIPLQ